MSASSLNANSRLTQPAIVACTALPPPPLLLPPLLLLMLLLPLLLLLATAGALRRTRSSSESVRGSLLRGGTGGASAPGRSAAVDTHGSALVVSERSGWLNASRGRRKKTSSFGAAPLSAEAESAPPSLARSTRLSAVAPPNIRSAAASRPSLTATGASTITKRRRHS